MNRTLFQRLLQPPVIIPTTVVIAILAVVVVLTLNPIELLRQSRDANRISDMATLVSAINLYQTDQSGASTYSLGSSNTVSRNGGYSGK